MASRKAKALMHIEKLLVCEFTFTDCLTPLEMGKLPAAVHCVVLLYAVQCFVQHINFAVSLDRVVHGSRDVEFKKGGVNPRRYAHILDPAAS